MSAIKVNGWPLVTMEFLSVASDKEALAWLQSLTTLLDRKQPFVLVMSTAANSQFSPEARKAQGLWFKQERHRIGHYCAGLARVVLDMSDADRVAGEAMQNAMPMPLFATVDAIEAKEWAQKQLDNFNSNVVADS